MTKWFHFSPMLLYTNLIAKKEEEDEIKRFFFCVTLVFKSIESATQQLATIVCERMLGKE